MKLVANMADAEKVVNMNKEKLKKEIIRSRKAIRRKYNIIRRNRYETERLMETGFKNILEPLREIKKELKDEHENLPSIKLSESQIDTVGETSNLLSPPRWPGRRPSVNINDDDTSNVFRSPGEHVFESTEPQAEDISEPIDMQDVSLLLNTTPEGAEYLDKLNPLPRKYIQKLISETNTIDYTSGVRFDSKQLKWMLGTFSLTFNGDDIALGEFTYPGTEGLYKLIFLKQPMIGTYTPTDLSNYKKILTLTNAHKENYGQGRRIIRTGIKYITIIKNLFPARHPSSTTGYGLLKEVVPNSKIEYMYWNSINELIDRLKLLYSAKLAGNTSLDNEIVSIITELKEANIIE